MQRKGFFLGPTILSDINPAMVDIGRKRLIQAGLAGRIAFAIGNAEALPFPTKSFDAYTIAFGIRNVTHIDRALAEAYRVLKTGGRFLCLEFSACEVPLLDRLYDFHSFEVIPRLGAAVEPVRETRYPNTQVVDRDGLVLFAAGFLELSFNSMAQALVQMHAPAAIRGRVIGPADDAEGARKVEGNPAASAIQRETSAASCHQGKRKAPSESPRLREWSETVIGSLMGARFLVGNRPKDPSRAHPRGNPSNLYRIRFTTAA
jgi:SAM-dependent methyltransferase